jgi:bifunctional non-homologous end joining protein LigD
MKKPCQRRSIQFVEHLTGDGPTVFDHVCRMGLEGIVSKRTDAPYRSGPSMAWLKSKNPGIEAVRGESERSGTKPAFTIRGHLGSVGIQDSHPVLVVIQAVDGPIRFD